jgi:thiosulfate/3-mercaptopyruvate sulfurtransferase
LFFDIEELSDKNNPVPLMLPPLDKFIDKMMELDVRPNDLIVCYDKCGMLSAPRAQWMLKTFGAKNVFILNGTFSKWKEEGRPIVKGES